MDKVYNINEALNWFLENHSGSVICVTPEGEYEAKTYSEAEQIFKN